VSDALKAAFLGLVQGVTEFFPISSSAHLKALREVVGFDVEGLVFDVAVHIATLFAVLIYFRREMVRVLKEGHGPGVLWRVGLATLPIIALGLLCRTLREELSLWSLVVCWLISACYLLLTRGRYGSGGYATLPPVRALLIGVAQAAALFPGISRSGASICAGLWLGLRREQAAKFSFLLAIPAIGAAGLNQTLELVTAQPAADAAGTSNLWLALGVAMPVAFLVGMAAIHLLLRIVSSDGFHRFGWYNFLAALAFALYLYFGRGGA
jgi:undecaprenyl-diphosphatase